MILVDTSVWVAHFRGEDRAGDLPARLERDEVLLHPWVLGELVLGGLGSRREQVVGDLRRLSAAPLVPDDEVLDLIVARRLTGRGVGWVDCHLVASALVARAEIWTLDGSLAGVASELGAARNA